MHSPLFQRYIGIDYSGAKTPTANLKGLRCYEALNDALPTEVSPPATTRKYWTRQGLTEWLVTRLRDTVPTLVGIDHSFSFPLRYFEEHHLALDWPAFLEDFQQHWPTQEADVCVEFIRTGVRGNGAARSGNARWRRLAEERAGAKSVFHFDVPGSVAKSTHAGLPWLRFIRNELGERVHFWPFDGWEIPADKSVIAEAYPSLWSKSFPREERTPDQHDAYAASRWMQQVDHDGSLPTFLMPAIPSGQRAAVDIEGWILGVR